MHVKNETLNQQMLKKVSIKGDIRIQSDEQKDKSTTIVKYLKETISKVEYVQNGVHSLKTRLRIIHCSVVYDCNYDHNHQRKKQSR